MAKKKKRTWRLPGEDISVDAMLDALEKDPSQYDRGDVLVTLQQAGYDVTDGDLPARGDVVAVLRKVVNRIDSERRVKALEQANHFARIVRVLAALEREESPSTPIVEYAAAWLEETIDVYGDEPVGQWAHMLRSRAPAATTWDGNDDSFNRMWELFEYGLNNREDDDGLDLAWRYYRRLVDAPDDLPGWSRTDYSKAIVALVIYMEGELPYLETSVDEHDGHDVADWQALPYDHRDEDNRWYIAPQLSAYAVTPMHDTSILSESNAHVVDETVEGYCEKAGPLAAWLADTVYLNRYPVVFRPTYEEDDAGGDAPPSLIYFVVTDLENQLGAYPILDEDDHSERLTEAEGEAAQDQAPYRMVDHERIEEWQRLQRKEHDLDEDEDVVWGWDLIEALHEMAEEDGDEWYPEVDDHGDIANWPKDKVVARALLNLRWLNREADEWSKWFGLDDLTLDDWLYLMPEETAEAIGSCVGRGDVRQQTTLFEVEPGPVAEHIEGLLTAVGEVFYDETIIEPELLDEFADALRRCGSFDLATQLAELADEENDDIRTDRALDLFLVR